ncbi:hypothetical protein QF011_000759 [Curtobacterium flaccumfaciens]|nr:hypothetical protein [Curtobacterium flaccumfaciens]MDQ0538218.1 hypothetical protein [Curtobacterium flaccumfaciens]
MRDSLEMSASQVADVVREALQDITTGLDAVGVSYADKRLASALTPRKSKHEVAFLFDTQQIADGFYGMAAADAWIPALRIAAPESSNSILTGDLIDRFSDGNVADALQDNIVQRRQFTARTANQFYAVYITNLTENQVVQLNEQMFASEPGYIGYSDCSVSNSLKPFLLLPSLAVRLKNAVIMPGSAETDIANPLGYPFSTNGFEVKQVDPELYDMFLHFKLDNEIPAWRKVDGEFALMSLSGHAQMQNTMPLHIDEERFKHLSEQGSQGHGASLSNAGLDSLSREALTDLVQIQIARRLTFNLRVVEGSRKGESGERVRDPNLDALMFSVQIEVPQNDGRKVARRMTVGVKYFPADHRGEVVTLF